MLLTVVLDETADAPGQGGINGGPINISRGEDKERDALVDQSAAEHRQQDVPVNEVAEEEEAGNTPTGEMPGSFD